jgi:hypothetical protein
VDGVAELLVLEGIRELERHQNLAASNEGRYLDRLRRADQGCGGEQQRSNR